jgi:serine/threonine protein phosphatase PrpC
MTGPEAREPILHLGRSDDALDLRAIAGGHAAVYSLVSPQRQTANEDAVALIPIGGSRAVLIVADGVGGLPGGGDAAACAVRCMLDSLSSLSGEEGEIRAAILDGIERANLAVQGLGGGAATTIAVAEIGEGSVRAYHVGDSTILVVGQRGKLKLQTVAHSPVGFAVEAGVLDESEAMHHAERHIVSNVLGTRDMRIEVGSALALAPRDTVLVASDGLVDNLLVGEIVECVRRGALEKAARRLADDARRRMLKPSPGEPSKPDDCSFIVYRAAR